MDGREDSHGARWGKSPDGSPLGGGFACWQRMSPWPLLRYLRHLFQSLEA